jgi:hypothetical protein
MRIEIQEFKSKFKLILAAEDPKEAERLKQIEKATGNENSPQGELHLTLNKHEKDE